MPLVDLGPATEEKGLIDLGPADSSEVAQENPEQIGQRADEEYNLSMKHNIPLEDSQQLLAGPEPSWFGKQLTKIQEFITEKTGLLQPDIGYISPRKDRMEAPVKTLGQVGVYQAANFASGLSITSLDVLTNKTVGDKSLSAMVARLTGFEPSDIDVSAGESGQYITALAPVGYGIGAASRILPVSTFLKTLLASGLTFGSTEAAIQFSKNITEDKPVDWNEIHFQSGVGVLFGAGEFAVASAMAGIAKGMEKYFGQKGIELAGRIKTPGVSLEEQVLAQEMEIKADIARARQTFKETGRMPEDLMEKYVYGKPQEGSSLAPKPEPGVKTAEKAATYPVEGQTSGGVVTTPEGGVPSKPKQGGFVDVSGPSDAVKEIVENGITYVKETVETTKKMLDALKFYPNTPMEFRNAVRTEIIGAGNQAGHKIYSQLSPTLLGNLSRDDIEKAAQIFYAKDEIARTKSGKGNPDLSLEDAQKQYDDLVSGSSPEILQTVEKLAKTQKEYTDTMIERGLIDPEGALDDYARHYIIDYTPEWAFKRGLPPLKLRTPFRGYTKKAVGTKKEYHRTMESILFSFYEKELDNVVADFIEKQTAKYDILPTLSKEVKTKLFGVNDKGKIRQIKPGRIVDIKGKRYRSFSPDMPFARTFYPTENGELAMGGYKNLSLIPEDIYNSFNQFSQRGGPIIARVNQITRYWKSMAILSHYTGFNVNNIIGDTYAAMMQHPRPDKLLAEYTTALKYISGKGKGRFYDDLDEFIRKNDITEGMLTTTELASFRNSKNPFSYLLQKMQDFSEYREAINRVAYAASLLRESQAGNGGEMVKYHNWVDTTGLDEQTALGKIARDVEVDYKWVSKSWSRYVSGGVAPFGTWYFKMSANVWKWASKHWGKALMAFLAAPVISTFYNDRNEESREMEKSLPDSMRNRVHFILGKNADGTTKVLSLQLPQDALIGTKIFSIAVSYANRVALREMNATEAAIKTLKEWGYKETAGTSALLAPVIRFIAGLAMPGRKDPYDKSPVYSKDPTELPKGRYWKETMLYGVKCMTPFLSASIATYEKGLPQDIAWRQTWDTLAGKRAFGIYDVNSKTDRIIELSDGEKVSLSWDDNAKIEWITREEGAILDDFEDTFVKSGMQPDEFYKTIDAQKQLVKIHQLWNKFAPDLNKDMDVSKKADFVVQKLGERVLNRIFSAGTLSKWYQVRLGRAKTDEEKMKLGQEYKNLMGFKIEEAIKAQPKSAREAWMSIKLKGSEMPVELLWELP